MPGTPLLRRGRTYRTGRGFGAEPHSMKARGHNAKSAHQRAGRLRYLRQQIHKHKGRVVWRGTPLHY